MAKRYDATTKQLLEAHPADWLAFAGLSAASELHVVDADLSAYTVAADKVIRVDAPEPYVAHFEFQAGPDPHLDRRVSVYHVLLMSRHDLPVKSVAVLPRPEAQSPGVVGRVEELHDADSRLDFRYRLPRVWE